MLGLWVWVDVCMGETAICRLIEKKYRTGPHQISFSTLISLHQSNTYFTAADRHIV